MSAPVIIQRTISAVQENAAQIANGQFGRLITLPVAWSKVRVGVRIHGIGGASIGGTARLAVGLGSGTTAMIGDASATNWIGLITNALTWTWFAPDHWQGLNYYPAKKVGATLTIGGVALQTGDMMGGIANTTGIDRSVIFCDIAKGSPNYTLNVLGMTSWGPTDTVAATFYAQMIQLAPAIANHTYSAGQTLAFDEVAGTLNAVQVWWNNAGSAMEICDVAVAVLA